MRVKTLLVSSVVILVTAIAPGLGVANTLNQTIAQRVTAVNDKVVAWRRDIHANPELSNREFRTSALVAQHLRSLGIEVQTGVAHTGVIGLLKGGKPGPVIALRADMDALPVVEKTGLPYASTVRGEYQGRDVGVMHACGHDTHVAILMGAAEVLAAVREAALAARLDWEVGDLAHVVEQHVEEAQLVGEADEHVVAVGVEREREPPKRATDLGVARGARDAEPVVQLGLVVGVEHALAAEDEHARHALGRTLVVRVLAHLVWRQ